MSDETFGIMRGLDRRMLEAQVALQGAPLLTGIKMSNLLNAGADKKTEAENPASGILIPSSSEQGIIRSQIIREEALESKVGQKRRSENRAEF